MEREEQSASSQRKVSPVEVRRNRFCGGNAEDYMGFVNASGDGPIYGEEYHYGSRAETTKRNDPAMDFIKSHYPHLGKIRNIASKIVPLVKNLHNSYPDKNVRGTLIKNEADCRLVSCIRNMNEIMGDISAYLDLEKQASNEDPAVRFEKDFRLSERSVKMSKVFPRTQETHLRLSTDPETMKQQKVLLDKIEQTAERCAHSLNSLAFSLVQNKCFSALEQLTVIVENLTKQRYFEYLPEFNNARKKLEDLLPLMEDGFKNSED